MTSGWQRRGPRVVAVVEVVVAVVDDRDGDGDAQQQRQDEPYYAAVPARGLRMADLEAREIELGYLVAPADVENPASERVAERCGYLRERVMRSTHLKNGIRIDADRAASRRALQRQQLLVAPQGADLLTDSEEGDVL